MSIIDVDQTDIDIDVDPDDALFETYLREPQPCFVLREDLSPRKLFWLAQTYCIVDFEIDGKRRFGVLTKIYKHDFDKLFTKEAFDRTVEWFEENPTDANRKKV